MHNKYYDFCVRIHEHLKHSCLPDRDMSIAMLAVSKGWNTRALIEANTELGGNKLIKTLVRCRGLSLGKLRSSMRVRQYVYRVPANWKDFTREYCTNFEVYDKLKLTFAEMCMVGWVAQCEEDGVNAEASRCNAAVLADLVSRGWLKQKGAAGRKRLVGRKIKARVLDRHSGRYELIPNAKK